MKRGQIRRCQGLDKLGRNVVVMRTPPVSVFFQLRFKKRQFCFGRRFGRVKKHELFINIFTTIHWVEPAWPAKPILLISTLLMTALSGDAAGKAG